MEYMDNKSITLGGRARPFRTSMEEKPRKLKQCPNNPAHVWMADIPFCPYCNLSEEARIYYDQKEREEEGKKKHDDNIKKRLPTWGIWKTKNAPNSPRRSDFEYEGSIEIGTTLYFGSENVVRISKENYKKLLDRFKGKSVIIGTPHEKDLPEDTVGGFLQKIMKTQTNYASYVGPILIHEGFAIKGKDQTIIEFL